MARLTWNVTGQQNGQTIIDDAGNVIVGAYIYFTTGEGVQGRVFVPDSQRTPANVKTAIHHEATKVDDISRLKVE